MSDWRIKSGKGRIVRAFALCFTCVLIFSAFLLGGCGNQKPGGTGAGAFTEDEDGIPNYWIQNPLEVNSIQEGADQEGDVGPFYTRVEISGLKDKEVESAINQRIQQLYQELKESREIPPYRGVLTMKSESDFGDLVYVNMFVYGCFNNVLSIYAYRSGTLNGVYFSDVQPLNFDLNTGKEITLGDVFRDGEDYQNFLGERVFRTLSRKNVLEEGGYDAYEGVTLVAPFQGISENQKFLLAENAITLIFDYENPEFFLQYNDPYTVELGYNEFPGAIALENRFYDAETDLYESEEPTVMVLVPYIDETKVIESVPMGDTPENAFLSVTYRYGSDTPEELRQEVGELAVQIDQEKVDEILAQGKKDPNYFFEYNKDVSVERIGNFYNVMDSSRYYQKDMWGEKMECRVYDQYLRPVAISDFFYEGVDYKPLIREKLEQAYQETYSAVNPYTGESMDTPVREYSVDELIEGMTFSLQQDGIFFYTEPIQVSVEGVENNYAAPLFANLSFEEIGCEKMTIFGL